MTTHTRLAPWTLVNALAYQAIGVNDLLARMHGHTLFDDSATAYGSAIPALIPDAAYGPVNAAIRRYIATPDALAWLEANYEPTPVIATSTHRTC